MDKSHVTLFVCPWCKKETGELGLHKQLKQVFEMHTPAAEPCETCRKEKAVIVFDRDTKEFIAWIPKEKVLNTEGLARYEGTSVKMLGKLTNEGLSLG